MAPQTQRKPHSVGTRGGAGRQRPQRRCGGQPCRAALLGEDVDESTAAALAAAGGKAIDDAPDWGKRALGVGKPLFLGLAVFAITGATITWVTVNVLWTMAVKLRRRRGANIATAPPV